MGLWADIKECKACSLHKSMICQPIPGFTKNHKPDVMIIGEAPGSDECLIEKPFQGLAGKLLDKMLNSAMINRDNLYITNIVKCRPTVNNAGKKNRPPTKEEIKICNGWLEKEITIVKPKLIIALGIVPVKTLLTTLKRDEMMEEVCGKVYKFNYNEGSSDIVPLYHPSSLLQSSKDRLEMCQNILIRLKKEYHVCVW